MPYCPKCDMEFVEGITVCTDCGGPLVESKEAALALQAAEKEKREQEMRLRYEEMQKAAEKLETEKQPERQPAGTYVKKEQRYEDMNSSASAFFLVGGVLAVIAAVSLLGYLPLPLYGVSRILFHVLLILMAAGSIAVAVSSKKSAARLKVQAADEEKETEDILQWFLKTYSARGLDDQLLMEDPELSGEELELKRFELIQDYLVTGRDLPDQSYADALCDMIYERLYGKN
ncbi:MAG: hypothetical protein ACOX8F_01125 [Sakamotonia sp.]|jgi:hypothetical protein